MNQTLPAIVDAQLQEDIRAAFEPAALASLMDQFLTAIANEALAIEAGERDGDREAVESAAHRLASAAGQFGFPELTGVARALEAGRVSCRDSGLSGALERARVAAAQLRG